MCTTYTCTQLTWRCYNDVATYSTSYSLDVLCSILSRLFAYYLLQRCSGWWYRDCGRVPTSEQDCTFQRHQSHKGNWFKQERLSEAVNNKPLLGAIRKDTSLSEPVDYRLMIYFILHIRWISVGTFDVVYRNCVSTVCACVAIKSIKSWQLESLWFLTKIKIQ